MPRVGKLGNSTLNKKNKSLELSCSMCGKIKKSTEFYQSWNPLHKTQKLPFCKQCLKEMCYDRDGNIDVEKTKEMLKAIDRPFIYEVFKASVEDRADTIGIYFKNLGMPQYRDCTYNDSMFEPHIEERKNRDIIYKQHDDFELTPEIIEKWGEGYKDEEYRLFEKKYTRLVRSYHEKTEMHSEALITYIRYRVKEEMASAKGDSGEAKRWGEMANTAGEKAKINPSQMSKSDISGGIDVISQLFENVESVTGLIPLLPKLMEQPYDDADMIIWSIINYIRRLEEKPVVRYRDIYNFYDEMLREHYKQNGWNEQQIELFLKKRNNVFRDMEEIYIEPIYSKEHFDTEDGES